MYCQVCTGISFRCFKCHLTIAKSNTWTDQGQMSNSANQDVSLLKDHSLIALGSAWSSFCFLYFVLNFNLYLI